jgi:hypothetical protein
MCDVCVYRSSVHSIMDTNQEPIFVIADKKTCTLEVAENFFMKHITYITTDPLRLSKYYKAYRRIKNAQGEVAIRDEESPSAWHSPQCCLQNSYRDKHSFVEIAGERASQSIVDETNFSDQALQDALRN